MFYLILIISNYILAKNLKFVKDILNLKLN